MATIAFLGTGLMGAGLVEAAGKRGDTVRAWNRTTAKAKSLERLGVTAHEEAREAVAGAERVHLMLSDDAAVDATLASIDAALAPGIVVIDHSTTSPAGVTARAAKLEARGVGFLHAPVFMSPAMCRDSKGVMLAAGAKATFDRYASVLQAMTGKLEYLGERRDLAAAQKLFGNAMIVAITAGLSDVYAIASALGIEAPAAHSLFNVFNPAAVLSYRGLAMAKGDYRASFELTMARKDVRLMIEAAGERPLVSLPPIAKRMDELIARGFGQDDLGVLSIDAVPKKTAG